MGKGADFERTICNQLSEWWSGGTRTDIFWRSSNSGGRATVRGRKGKKTFGHYGDVSAVDPIGAPLLQLFAIEIKRGYAAAHLHALLDRPNNAAQQEWEKWIEQAMTSSFQSGSISWLIIARRDKRNAIVVLQHPIADELNLLHIGEQFQMNLNVRLWLKNRVPLELFAMPFESFLEQADPKEVKELLEQQ